MTLGSVILYRGVHTAQKQFRVFVIGLGLGYCQYDYTINKLEVSLGFSRDLAYDLFKTVLPSSYFICWKGA